MNKSRLIAWIVTALVVASVVATYLQRSPSEVARAHASEHGTPGESLSLLSDVSSRPIIAASATVTFQVKGAVPLKNLVVELRRPVYFLPWQVVGFREEAEE